MGALTWPLGPADAAAARLPVGVPLGATRAYVVDDAGTRVPPGVVGELWLGGAGVARGYLPQPAWTADRFVPDALSGPPGARLYRTGDRVRARADGALEFLGRRDGQVKIRGHRVELGELEAVLGEYGGVAQRVVVRRETPAGDAQLVAYVVAAPGVTGAAVRTWLQTRVPEALVPAAVVVLDALPLTGNGKVDRAALPAPAAAAPAAIAVAPATALEEIVAGAWAEVLARPAVSVTANFFDLGGHSLLATQLVARLRTLLGVEVPVRAVFETPTVRGLTALVDPTRAAARGVGAPPLTAGPRPAVVPLSFAQQRLWFLDQLAPGQATYNAPRAYRLEGPLAIGAVIAAVRAVVARHEVLRTTLPAVDGVPVQRIAPPPAVPVPVIDLTALPAPAGEAAARQWAAGKRARRSISPTGR